MSLNLIEDPWIPVLCADGARRVIAPWQMADPGILRPGWPRADLNIACYELLIGLVFLADPPSDSEDWEERRAPDPARLRERLARFAPAFDLLGDGPRFLQDIEPLTGEPNPVDMLFIDSAGANTARNNADLMVHRDRYDGLDLPLAAMALFTFQGHAPAGGAGNRTSMRGGGPMVTLIDPQAGLWPLVWANVPDGRPAQPQDLPWMRPTRTSEPGRNARGEKTDGLKTLPPEGRLFGVEAFFGMPRRLRLLSDGVRVTGVVQKPWGTNYALWKHPLSPYYRLKVGEEWLPVHPRAGRFGYRNWLGVVARQAGSDLREVARVLRDWGERGRNGAVIVAGWAMDNMKPRDFIWSVQPWLALSQRDEDRLTGMILAAEAAGVILRGALKPVLAAGEAREAEREAFFIATEPAFERRLAELRAGQEVGPGWRDDLRKAALERFDALALLGLDRRKTDEPKSGAGPDPHAIRAIVKARQDLLAAFSGHTPQGKAMFVALDLELPVARKGKAA